MTISDRDIAEAINQDSLLGSSGHKHLRDLFQTASDSTPIPMRLVCERCGALHIDEGEFATKPHHTHTCQHCGLNWRPAKVCTVGVRFIPGFKNAEPTAAEPFFSSG